MRFKRWLTAIIMSVAVVAAPLVAAPPAHADGWRWSTCNSQVQIYGVPGRGGVYWSARYGYVTIYDDMYSVFANHGWECTWGDLRTPIKWSDGPHPLGEFSSSSWTSYGLWFQGGAIHRLAPYGLAVADLGNYGQCSGSCYG